MCRARFLQRRAGWIAAVTIWTGTEVRTQQGGRKRGGGDLEEGRGMEVHLDVCVGRGRMGNRDRM